MALEIGVINFLLQWGDYNLVLLRVIWVLALYWPCRWYRGYKQRHSNWWLSYL